MLQFNKYQTQLTDELLDSLHKEVKEELIDLTSNVEYIKRMISPNRQYAKDRPRDEKSRIIVDISNPHILEDMDYFRPTGNFYRKHGVITKLRPNANPNSEFGKWLSTEVNRIWFGMVRESDGEWVTGQMYFYLNYMPIIQTKIRPGTKIADRVVDFPEVWDGVYLWFHYLEQARNGGIYNEFNGGQHAGQIAKRGASKAHPYSQHVYTPDGLKQWGDIQIGDYLFGDNGEKTQVVDIPFDGEAHIYKITLANNKIVYASEDHLWEIYHHTDNGGPKIVPTMYIWDYSSYGLYVNNYNKINFSSAITTQDDSVNFNTDDYKQELTIIKDIEYFGVEKAKCVTVDNKSHCYLIGDFITTHNSYTCASMMSRMFVCGDNDSSCENTRVVINAADKEKLIKDGTLNKFVECIDFCAEHTQFPSQRLKSSLSDMTWVMGYIDSQTLTSKGTNNTVLGVTVGDDTGKSRGKRSNLFLYEEFGAFPKFIDVWNTNFRSVQEGSFAFGQAVFIGTGGEEGNDFAGALEMIYNPVGYNVYALPNIYDKNSQGKQKTIFFFGACVSRKGFYDKDGNSDIIGALIEILTDRVRIKYNSTDSMSLTRAKAEDPITLQEAIMKRESTIYPVSDLTDRINELDFNPHSLDDILVGKLAIKGDKVVYELDSDLKPIREFPHKDNKLKGAIEIHQLPKVGSDGKVLRGRYIAGGDTIDDDESETLSLGSIYILDLYTDEIVFEYTGRDQFADDFYEICRRALLYYNAELNYENNKKGLFTYFSKHNCLYLLSDTLEFLKDKEMVRYGSNNKSKGTLSTAPIKGYYRRCIRDYLLKPVNTIKVIDGEEEEVKVPMLFKMKSRALLKELTLWSADGNYDRHDAFGMLMLIREDKLRLLGGNTPDEYNKQRDSNYLGEDKFFTDNYRVDRVKNTLNF